MILLSMIGMMITRIVVRVGINIRIAFVVVIVVLLPLTAFEMTILYVYMHM